MNPKEIMQKYFIFFERGDWEDFRNLHSHNVIVHLNGIHKLSGRYSEFTDFVDNLVYKIPTIFCTSVRQKIMSYFWQLIYN